MDKVRVYYNNDGIVMAVEYFTKSSLLSDEDMMSFRKTPGFEDYNIKLFDKSFFENQHEYTQQFFLEEEEVKIDENKEKHLMPLQLVKEKELSSLREKIDEQMTSDAIDPVALTILQNDLDKCKSNNDELFWAEKALAGLDRAEIDKPVIRQKLEEKISKLRGES